MANMGYCRFENTLEDLRDCYEHVGDEGLSESEHKCRDKLMKLCRDIVGGYSEFGDNKPFLRFSTC
jgi:hypothetical protein